MSQLEESNEKMAYRIKHLLRAIDPDFAASQVSCTPMIHCPVPLQPFSVFAFLLPRAVLGMKRAVVLRWPVVSQEASSSASAASDPSVRKGACLAAGGKWI